MEAVDVNLVAFVYEFAQGIPDVYRASLTS
jgi:hypothetical protein